MCYAEPFCAWRITELRVGFVWDEAIPRIDNNPAKSADVLSAFSGCPVPTGEFDGIIFASLAENNCEN